MELLYLAIKETFRVIYSLSELLLLGLDTDTSENGIILAYASYKPNP